MQRKSKRGSGPLTVSPWRSVGHLLRQRAEVMPDRELLRFQGRAATYGEIEERSTKLASALAALGLATGDRVAIMLPNGIDFPVVWLAVAKAGCVVVPVNVQYRDADLTHVLRDAGVRAIVVGLEQFPQVDAVRSRCPTLHHVSLLASPPAGCHAVDLHQMAAVAHPTMELESVNPQDLVTIQYTSGTTGFPKGCLLTHEYWLRLATAVRDYAAIDRNDVLLTAQPFTYMDPTWNVLVAMLAAAPLVVLPRFSASTFWQSVRNEGVTFFYCLGTMPLYLMKQPPNPAVERNHRVRLVMCSGIPPTMHAVFEERWACPWREVYGTTELGAVLFVPASDDTSVGTGAMGRPVPGREVRVVDEAGAEVEPGTIGELVVRGSGIMLGYHGDAEATARWRRSGWAHTGDLVYRDDRGYYHLVGRIKDMIRRAGENIAAAEIEAALCEHPSVRAAACIPVPDELRGEEVKAFIQLQPGQSPASVPPAQLASFMQDRVAAFKVPRFYEYVDQFPMTPSERIAKSELLAAKTDQRAGAYDVLTETWG